MAVINYSFGKLEDELSLHVGDDDPVNAIITLNRERIPIVIKFVPHPNTENPEHKLSWKSENGLIHFTFFEWNNELGSTTTNTKSQIGATASGQAIFILVSHKRIQHLNVLQMQFVLGHPVPEVQK